MEGPASLTSEQNESLRELAENTNQQFETDVANASSRAFNLGCSLWLVPGIIIILVVFLVSRANWAMTSIVFVIVASSAAIFTLFVSQQAKRKSAGRIYRQTIDPEIDLRLQEIGVSRASFDSQARASLQPGSLLLEFLEQGGAEQLPVQEEK